MSWDHKLYHRYLTTRRFGRELIYLESVDSTNRWLLEHHDQFVMAGAVVVAAHQSAGRGRRDRRWFDHSGSSILASLLIRHANGAEGLAFLSLLPAIAIARALVKRFAAQDSVTLKWPNDVLIRGKKVAGILAQSTVQGGRHICAIGCGINLNTGADAFPSDIAETASSIALEYGEQLSREVFLADVLNELEPLHDEWQELEFETLRQAWEQLGPAAGIELIRDQDGERIKGRYLGLGHRGELRLANAHGEVTEYLTGDILQ